MKKLIPISVCLICLSVGCSTGSHTNQAKGVLIEATNISATIVTETNDTMAFSIPTSVADSIGGVLPGDTVEIYFMGSYKPSIQAENVVVYPKTGLIRNGATASAATGEMQQLTYEGLLPSASGCGIEYRLTVMAREHSGDGAFELVLTYKGADNGKDKSFTYCGKRFTQRGIPGDDNATVWQCVSDNDDQFNFLREDGTTLLLLNDDFEKPESKLNYKLQLVRQD